MPEPAHSDDPLAGEGTEHVRRMRPPLPRLPLTATVDTVPDGARVSVIVRGELDLETGQRLWPELLHALNGSAGGVDLYLSEVTFCDCSGINLLLALRRAGLRHGKSVTVVSNSAAVERMFDLTATRRLFERAEPSSPSSTSGPSSPPEPSGDKDAERGGRTRDEALPDQDSGDSLRSLISQVRRPLQTPPAGTTPRPEAAPTHQPHDAPQPGAPDGVPEPPDALPIAVVAALPLPGAAAVTAVTPPVPPPSGSLH